MSLRKKVLLTICAVLLFIQFIRPTKNQGKIVGPQHISNVVDVPENISLILNTSCYDCHSNSTRYYWYSEIMPIGWWLNHHVEEGKEELNFSEFTFLPLKKQDHKLEEVKEEVIGKEMPIKSYTRMHKNAELTKDQIKLISDWIDVSRKKLQN